MWIVGTIIDNKTVVDVRTLDVQKIRSCSRKKIQANVMQERK